MGFGEREIDFRRVDRRYAELKRLCSTGEITGEKFNTLLIKESMGRDAEGRWWVKSRASGEWHYHDGSTWRKGDPPNYQPVTPDSKQEGGPEARTMRRQTGLDRRGRWNQGEVLGVAAAMFAGIIWAVEGTLRITASRDLVAAVFITALLGTLGGLVGLHARQAPSYGRLGLAGLSLSFAGITLWLFGFVIHPDWLSPLAVLGVLVVGFVLLGAATLRARVLPRWCALALLAFPVFFCFNFEGSDMVLGLVWIAVGCALWAQRHVPTGQPGSAS